MKGMVFTEFLDMVDARWGGELTERIVERAAPASGGSYTAVGTYPHAEMVGLVVALSQQTAIAVPELLRAFGEHLFARFVTLYPSFFAGRSSAFAILRDLEGVIHVEVRKLYPDAELPHFDVLAESSDRMVLVYRSTRHMADFAEGLIRGCLAHFDERMDIDRVDESTPTLGVARFTLVRQTA